jgi:homoserine dehydrogenase
MRKGISLILIAGVCFAGCGRVGENTLSGILEKDPSFRKILNAKKRIDAKALSLKENYDKEKTRSAQKIRLLKENLQNMKNDIDAEIRSVKQEMEPQIRMLKAALEEARAEYERGSKFLKSSLDKLKNIKKLLTKKSELALSGDEISIWNKRAAGLKKEIDASKRALEELKNKTYLLKTEIRILQE